MSNLSSENCCPESETWLRRWPFADSHPYVTDSSSAPSSTTTSTMRSEDRSPRRRRRNNSASYDDSGRAMTSRCNWCSGVRTPLIVVTLVLSSLAAAVIGLYVVTSFESDSVGRRNDELKAEVDNATRRQTMTSALQRQKTDDLASTIDEMRLEINQLQEKVDGVNDALVETAAELAKVKDEKSLLQAELQKTSAAVERMEGRVNETDNAKMQLEAALQDTNVTLLNVVAELVLAKETNGKLLTELEAHAAETLLLKAELNETSAHGRAMRVDLRLLNTSTLDDRVRLEHLGIVVGQIRSQLDTNVHDTRRLENESNQTKADVVQLIDEVHDLNMTLRQTMIGLEQLVDEKRRIRDDLQLRSAESLKIQGELDVMNATVYRRCVVDVAAQLNVEHRLTTGRLEVLDGRLAAVENNTRRSTENCLAAVDVTMAAYDETRTRLARMNDEMTSIRQELNETTVMMMTSGAQKVVVGKLISAVVVAMVWPVHGLKRVAR